MIPLEWKTYTDLPAALFPNDGDSDDPLADDLGDLVGSYYVESYRAVGELRAFRLYQNARTIDAIRLRYVRGEIDAVYANVWLDAAHMHLRNVIAERAS